MKNKFIPPRLLYIENITTQTTTSIITEHSNQTSISKSTFKTFNSMKEEVRTNKMRTAMRFQQIQYLLQCFQMINRIASFTNRVGYYHKYAFLRKLKLFSSGQINENQLDSPKSQIEEFLQTYRQVDEKQLENQKLNEIMHELYLEKASGLIEKVLGRRINQTRKLFINNLQFLAMRRNSNERKLLKLDLVISKIALIQKKLAFIKFLEHHRKQFAFILLFFLLENYYQVNRIVNLSKGFTNLRNPKFSTKQLLSISLITKKLNISIFQTKQYVLNVLMFSIPQAYQQDEFLEIEKIPDSTPAQMDILNMQRIYSKTLADEPGTKSKPDRIDIHQINSPQLLEASRMRDSKKKKSSLLKSKFRSILHMSSKAKLTLNEQKQFCHLNLKEKIDQFIEHRENKKYQEQEEKKIRLTIMNKNAEYQVMVSKGIILLILGIVVAIIIHLTIGL